MKRSERRSYHFRDHSGSLWAPCDMETFSWPLRPNARQLAPSDVGAAYRAERVGGISAQVCSPTPKTGEVQAPLLAQATGGYPLTTVVRSVGRDYAAHQT